jgi:hypothetical protein
MRLIGFLVILGALAASGYVLVGKARTGDLNPARKVSEAEARLELASAQYVLAIVAGQLAQVHALSGTYADTLDFKEFPLVRLVRADEDSYCLEFEKTQTYVLAGPGGTVAQGTC